MTQGVERLYGLDWSNDYDKFKILNYNRDIDQTRVDKIKKVIASDGFLVPILVNQDWYVVDGQHRLNAVRQLGKKLSYVQYDIPTDKLPIIIAKLNSTAKTWKMINYLDMWYILGKEHYVWIGETVKNLDLPFTNFYKMLTSTAMKFSQKFKDGTLTLTQSQRDRLEERGKQFNEVRFSEKRFADFGTGFLVAITNIVTTKGYDHQTMMTAIKEYPGSLLKCRTASEFKGQLLDLYNRMATPKNKIR